MLPSPRRTSAPPRRGLRRALLAVLCAVSVTVTGLVSPAPAARAADLSQFNPGHLITDQNFWDSTVMGAAEVQAFLDTRGASCRVGTDGSPCLKNFTATTPTRAATAYCGGYDGRAAESAATIITRVGIACGVSPRVLLVLLQKEQGLVTTTNPTATKYRSATGYGCPDTAPCDAAYYGFVNQVYQAASRFRQYAATPSIWRHQAGQVEDVYYHPNIAACGSSKVRIHNQATAGLYNYTPYQPNAAALAAGYGTGDACSSYGNRNFYNYYYDWFGDPTGVPPVGALDAVTVTNTGLTVHGWALDPDTTNPIDVHVYVDGVGTSFRADASRPDIAAIYGKGDRHGYAATVPQRPGPHSLCVYAINADPGRNTLLGCRTAVVPDVAPIGAVDSVTATSRSITLSGWTLDPDTTASIDAHVYVDGVGVALRAEAPRPDIAAAFGKGDRHGFSHTVTVTPGRHDVCVYGIGSVAGGANTLLTCRSVIAQDSQAAPTGVLDSVTTSPSGVTVSGWTLDPDTTDPTDVHLYVDGVGVAVRADQPRPDIAAAFGKGELHGFTATRALAAGRHSMCAYAINTGPGPHTLLGCRDFTVPANTSPIGAVDAVTPSAGAVTVSGWVLDPDTSSSTDAHVYIDGVGVAVAADQSRPDIAAAFGKGDRHGFGHTRTLSPGQHSVCVYGIDTTGSGHTLLACRTFVVPA